MTDRLPHRLLPSPDAMESRVGEETVILHLGNGSYYGLDPVGTRIWAMLGEGLPLPSIRNRVAADYGVEATRIEADMDRFLRDLLGHDILVEA